MAQVVLVARQFLHHYIFIFYFYICFSSSVNFLIMLILGVLSRCSVVVLSF